MTRADAPERATILVVDDDADLASILQMMLVHGGYDVHVATSGQDALNWLNVNRPDLILLDLMMPDISGFTILRKMRASDRHASMPIVVLTAKADPKTRDETRDAGASEFLTKPINAQSLLDHVRRALAARGGQ
jgi:DNA-binding response OmpR family regulator